MDLKPTLKKPISKQSKEFEKNFKKTMNQNNVILSEMDSLLNENEFSLKKKIFDLSKMEALVFSDPKLLGVYEEMSENGDVRYGYHYNETIMNMLFNDYVLNSPKYLQKYKMAIPKEKKRRDKSGLNQLKKTGEKVMQNKNVDKPKPQSGIELKPSVNEMDSEKTKVMFLVNEKDPKDPDLFAYFPDEIDHDDFRTAYSHIGQHSAAHPDYAKESRPATPEEYNDLKAELEGIGYNLEIINQTNETTGAASSGSFSPALGQEKKIMGVQENETETDKPEEDDCFISSNGNKLSVSCGGKFINKFIEMTDALNAVKTWKASNKYYPNTWFVSDHGNYNLIDDEGNILNETTTAGSAGGAAGYVGYAGPASWGGGDLMKGGKSKIMKKPIWKGGTIIQESKINYLIDSTGFEKYIDVLNEQFNREEKIDFIGKNSDAYGTETKNMNNSDINTIDKQLKTHKLDSPNLNVMEQQLNSRQQKIDFLNDYFEGDNQSNVSVTPSGWLNDLEDYQINVLYKNALKNQENLPEEVKEDHNADGTWEAEQDLQQLQRNGASADIEANNHMGLVGKLVDEANTMGELISALGEYFEYKKINNSELIQSIIGKAVNKFKEKNKIKEDTQTMIQDKQDSMSNKMIPTNNQGGNVPMGFNAGGSSMSENTNILFEELNNELNAYSIHQNKLKKMTEDRKPSALVLRDRVGSENEKNFKKDLQHSGTKEIIDIEKELQWKDQQTDVGKDPQKLSKKIEAKEISVTDGQALKDVGDSANDKGDEIPKRNLSKEEQEEVDKYRLGLGDLVYDNEVGKKYEDRMKADMGDKLYKQRQEKLEFRGKAPMYNKDTQPMETGVDKAQFDKEKSGWADRNGIQESMVTGKFFDALNKRKIIDFNLKSVFELTDKNKLQLLNEITFEGLGNTYNNKVKINENVVKAINEYKFYTDGKKVFALKQSVQNLTETEHKEEKRPVNEQFNKMKHLLGYNPDDFVSTKNIKKDRGF